MILSSVSPASVAFSAAAALAYVAPAAAASRLGDGVARAALVIAWLLHAAVLAMGLWGEPPRFGWAPALSVTVWLVLTFYLVEREIFPQLHARWGMALFGALALALALADPGVPLQRASAWLPLHVAFGVGAYGLFAAAVVHAWLMSRSERDMRLAAGQGSGVPLLTLERLTFRFAAAGFILLSATLVAGYFFSEQLYGVPARWDHKTVFSLLAWMVFAFLLLGRLRFGWRGRKAVRVLYAGSVLLLLAYAGSRFVLEVILGRPA